MLHDLKLYEKRYEIVDALSGGMKRRLSVAVSFIGGGLFFNETLADLSFAKNLVYYILQEGDWLKSCDFR